jgi:DNA repair photolyase
LLRRELASPKWVPRTIAISGVTDAYQPIERRLGLTRRCLAVLADFRNPVGVVTKGALVTRDVDLLAKLASFDAACVILSITTLDRELARTLEPRASLPEQRLRAIEALATCKVPVGVMTAPIIPGLNDHEIPRILEAAHQAGARFAAYVPLRLPGNVLPVFTEWLEHHTPDKRDRVLGRIRDMRDGRLNNPRFGERMRGKGPVAEAIEALFATTCRRLGLKRGGPKLDTSAFRNPDATKQLALFE